MRQPALQRAEPVDVDVDVPAVELDPVAVAADLRDGQAVGLAAVAELDRAADLVAGPGPATAGRAQEGLPLQRLLRLVDVDRHVQQRGVGAPAPARRLVGAGPVQPAGVGGAVDHLGPVQQLQQERLRRRAALAPPRWSRAARTRSRASASARSRPQAMILATIES